MGNQSIFFLYGYKLQQFFSLLHILNNTLEQAKEIHFFSMPNLKGQG